MSVEEKGEKLCISEAIEDPVILFMGEGSGEDSKVGNEEKKKIFFFGQPGCLKHSPLRGNSTDNHNNHKKECESTSNVDNITNAESSKDKTSDDEDGNELLDKISKVLDCELAKSLPVTPEKRPTSSSSTTTINLPDRSPASADQAASAIEESNATNKSENREDSHSNRGEILKCENESVELKSIVETNSENDSKAEEILESEKKDSSDKSETLETPPDVVQSNDKIEDSNKSLTLISKSIVPYDDDSTSSSQADAEKEPCSTEVSASDQKELETPQLNESASLQSNILDTLDAKPTSNISGNGTAYSKEEPLSGAVESNIGISETSEDVVTSESFLYNVDANSEETKVTIKAEITDTSVDKTASEDAVVPIVANKTDTSVDVVKKEASTFEYAFDMTQKVIEQENQPANSLSVVAEKVDEITQVDNSPEAIEKAEKENLELPAEETNNDPDRILIETDSNLNDLKLDIEDHPEQLLNNQEMRPAEQITSEIEDVKLEEPIISENLNEMEELKEIVSPDVYSESNLIAHETPIDDPDINENIEVQIDCEDVEKNDPNLQAYPVEDEAFKESERSLQIEVVKGEEMIFVENKNATENIASESPVEHHEIFDTPTLDDREFKIASKQNVAEKVHGNLIVEEPEDSSKTESKNELASRDDDDDQSIGKQPLSLTTKSPIKSFSFDVNKANSLSQVPNERNIEKISPESPPLEVAIEVKSIDESNQESNDYPNRLVDSVAEQKSSELHIVNENQKLLSYKKETADKVEESTMFEERSIFVNKASLAAVNEIDTTVNKIQPESLESPATQEEIESPATQEEIEFPAKQDEIESIEVEKEISIPSFVISVQESRPTFEELQAHNEQIEVSVKSTIQETENISSPEDFNDYQDDNESFRDSNDSDNELNVNHKSDPDVLPVESKSEFVYELKQTAESKENTNAREPETLIREVLVTAEDDVREKCPNIDKVSDTVDDLLPIKVNNLPDLEENQTLNQAKTGFDTSSEEITVDANKLDERSQEFTKPTVTRKRKMSERKSISESDSEGNNVTEPVSHDNTSEDEEVQKKKPRIRGKTTTPRKIQPSRRTADAKKVAEVVAEKIEGKLVEEPTETPKADGIETKQTLQNLQFDYDGTDDIIANVAAIRTMICKEPKKESASESEDEGSDKRIGNKRSRKTKRGRFGKRNEVDSSSDEASVGQSSKIDSKRSKTFDETKDQTSTPKKKREAKGMLKYIDTSLVIETTENEAPVRQSRRIAQQKIREETERRQMEEKMLKQMKLESEKKKKSGAEGTEDEDEIEEDHKESSGDDESFKELRRKKKSKIKPSDKQWQTSSSHSEHSESEDYLEHVPSDPGSPLFKSDHEFSPESDVDDTTQVQPVKRARTAKKLAAVSSSDDDEDINPNHACQVCHKTDSPEWILLCDECDCGYHCSCLKPIIFLIPSGNWYCPLCCHKKLIDNLSDQLSQLDTLIYNIETAEIRRQRQKQVEISEQNILQERRKNRADKERESRKSPPENKEDSNGSSNSDDSSDVPLTDYFYKLRKRNQTAAPSYRFNEYDDLINSAIRHEMDEVKGAGNLGRGKDIATIIEADKEEKEQVEENRSDTEQQPKAEKNEDEESSGSDIIRPKKLNKRKKKNRKLNNLDVSSEEERGSDEDFKGTSSSDSEVDEEDLSMSSVSESSLDLPSKKNKGRNIRSSTRNREKRFDRRFINDGDTDSDDEPLIKAKRSKKKDSDEEEFDLNDDDDDEGSLAEEIDSEDLCDDTDTDSSSENNWPKRKKKRVASYDIKPRKGPKKNDNEDKTFRAGISKKKVLKMSDKESDGSASETEKGRRKTRGKKLLYLIEDDLDSDESDGIKPGVKRPETPPEEREMFVKKQEEIKRMLAAKDTEAAKKLAAPTIQPINIPMEMPGSPSVPFPNEPASLSTIPKNVIESAKALDTDYNRIKPIALGSQTRGNDGGLQSNDMNEEELAKMMEEEDFAQHQLKLAGEAIARSKKLLELEAKEEFSVFNKVNREKEWPPTPPVEIKKRSRKSKSSDKTIDEFAGFSKALPVTQAVPKIPTTSSIPPLVSSNLAQQLSKHPMQMQPQPSLMANLMQQQSPYVSIPPNLTSDRSSVLSSFMMRPEMLPQHPKIHQPMPPEVFNLKSQPLPSQPYEDSDEKKKGRRKKFTPLRTDLVEGNTSKLAKLDPPSVIQSAMNTPAERVDDKSKVPRPDLPKLAVAPPPQIFNPATNPTPSVITRLLQPQQRPMTAYSQGFTEVGQPVGDNPNIRMYPEELKNSSPSKSRGPMQQAPLGGALPQSSFGENPFVPRNLHTLYRGPPPTYGIPPHARLPPYPFHHLHPNLRPATPYNMPPQFSYYAPPAHSRQPPLASAIPLNHGATQLLSGTDDISNSIRIANNSDEPSETSEFGGLVSYFSSQQELD